VLLLFSSRLSRLCESLSATSFPRQAGTGANHVLCVVFADPLRLCETFSSTCFPRQDAKSAKGLGFPTLSHLGASASLRDTSVFPFERAAVRSLDIARNFRIIIAGSNDVALSEGKGVRDFGASGMAEFTVPSLAAAVHVGV
jgi:hypothetical protein